MKKILFTYSTTENYKYVIKLLNNLERYGHIFRFIRLSKEIKFANNINFPNEYSLIYKKFANYSHKLNQDSSNVAKLINRLDHIYKEFMPDIVVIFGNKIDQTCGVLYEFSKLKKIKIFFSENTPIPGTFYIEKKPRFEFTKDYAKNTNFFEGYNYSKLIKRGKKITELIKKDLPRRHEHFNLSNASAFNSKKTKVLILGVSLIDHALLPTNHEYKINTFPIFNHYSEMIKFLYNYNDIDIWFKPHPAEGFKGYYNEIEKRDNFYLFSNTDNINELIKHSDIVISSLSKLEINAFALEKKIIFAGAGWFWTQGYCANKEEFRKAFENAICNFKNDTEYLNNFYACIALYEQKYVSFYDYLSKKELTSNTKQIEKFYKLIDLNIDLNKKFKFNVRSISQRKEYFKKIGWQPQNISIIILKNILKKIKLFNYIKKIIKI